jgi:hypothetical protein
MGNNNILIYQSADGKIAVDTTYEAESLWLSQKLMATLFECTPENILIHIKNIYETAELEESATTKDFLVVQMEGNRDVKRNIKHYNLDLIISCDTSIAHLAGSLGKKTLLLLNNKSDWRWGVRKKSTLLYPSFELFRNRQMNEWKCSFDKILNYLKKNYNVNYN